MPPQSLFVALRPLHWFKNLLIFLPLLASKQWQSSSAWFATLLCFIAFSLCASALYLINDLIDLHTDREHPTRSKRPIASGILHPSTALVAALTLVTASLFLASFINGHTTFWIGFYFVCGLIYTFLIKAIPWLETFLLTFFYVLRLLAAGASTTVALTYWLIGFIALLCYSLACLKRLVEFKHASALIKARGYHPRHQTILLYSGIIAAFGSIMILVLHQFYSEAIRYYQNPSYLWGSISCVAAWISLMWAKFFQGKMHHDPLLTCLKEPWSWALSITALILTVCASGY